MGVFKIKSIVTATVAEAIELQQLVDQHLIEGDVAQSPAAQGQGLGLGEGLEAQRHEQLQRRDLRLVFFGGVKAHKRTRDEARPVGKPASINSVNEASLRACL